MPIGLPGAILGGLSVASKLFGMDASGDAARLASRARKLRNRQSDLQSERTVREFIRGTQQARASALAEGVAMGGGTESSAVQGAISSIGSRANTELEFFSDFQTLETQAATLEGRAQREENRANVFGGIGSIFDTAFNIFAE